MIYWLFACILVLIILIISGFIKKNYADKKKLAEIKEQWGKPKDVYWNFNLIEKYLTDFGGNYAACAADLDLDDVFCYIDRTSSKPGQQYLFSKLHNSGNDQQDFSTLEGLIERFDQDVQLRERTQLKLFELNSDDAYYLTELFSKKQQTLFTPFVEVYIRMAAFLIVALTLVLIFAPNPFYWFLLFGCIITNLVVHYTNKTKILRYTHSLPQLLILNKVSNWLNDNGLLIKTTAIKQSLANVAKLKKSLAFINVQNKVAEDPTNASYMITEWIKIIFLLEPLSFVVSINKVNKYPEDIRALFDGIGIVDMAISVKSLRVGLPYFCKPARLNEGCEIIVEDLYHPLIENCVPNSISIDNNQGVLITGSNMAGKTTFIRTIAINALLSQTLNTSFSKAYQAPPLQILTSINMTDDLGAHKSYFQAEALSVRNIISHCIAGKPLNSLVIIDEIFRGTNTIERIAAAKAVLSYLIENKCFIMVSTHDLELAALLGKDYEVFSFEEITGDNRLTFDYKLKQGLLKNKNGIAVLKSLDYPPQIIEEARNISLKLREKYDL